MFLRRSTSRMSFGSNSYGAAYISATRGWLIAGLVFARCPGHKLAVGDPRRSKGVTSKKGGRQTMFFSRYDHPPNAMSRPSPEPEVRRAIMGKLALSERNQVRDARTASANKEGARL